MLGTHETTNQSSALSAAPQETPMPLLPGYKGREYVDAEEETREPLEGAQGRARKVGTNSRCRELAASARPDNTVRVSTLSVNAGVSATLIPRNF